MMDLSCLLPLARELPVYQEITRQLLKGKTTPKVIVLNTARAYLIASLYYDFNLPLMVITTQPEAAKKLYEELQLWCQPSTNLRNFPESEFSPYEYSAINSRFTSRERLNTLAALSLYNHTRTDYPDMHVSPSTTKAKTVGPHIQNKSGQDDIINLVTKGGLETTPPLIVSSALSIISKIITRQDFSSSCHILNPGMSIDPLQLLAKWQEMGYEMEDFVETPGEMSRRGGIVDIYPICNDYPVRIEFLGNEIESMRSFNPDNQCSIKKVSSLMVSPAKEAIISKAKTTSTLNSIYLDNCRPEVKQYIEEDLIKLKQNQWCTNAEFYFPMFNHGNIFHYLPDETVIVLDDIEEVKTVIERLNKESTASRDIKITDGSLPVSFPSPYLQWKTIDKELTRMQNLSIQSWQSDEHNILSMPFTSAPSYGGNLDLFLNTAKQIVQQKQRLLIVSQQTKRLAELMQDDDIYIVPTTQLTKIPPRSSITLFQGSVENGWIMADELIILTDSELFGVIKQRRPRRKTASERRWLIQQFNPGDYVVHIDHGIAHFSGLTMMPADGGEQEYLILEYAAGGKLYVPTDQIERVSHYVGSSGREPALNKLGSGEWYRTKKRVKESVAVIARELLGLYAAREVAPGFAFSPDTLWQHELEASFPYLETPDQAEAIAEVKEDMEKMKPMDRLICGDVGYGKTEVALRAAFKAVMDNKQVAVLVPTTVLAQQHFNTFNQRLQAFPLRVEMLSRFCSKEKAKEITEGLTDGSVDICIGTHSLLQKGIVLKDLGLVIIDEEQRFGVVQKERLRQIRSEVDVLTLSATPIPRTLHMSLAGIKDMSIMETPPEERLAIKTYIGVYDETLIRQAILRELERNGQVFFVHNRVQDIAIVANKLENLIPEATISIAHGQMSEDKLEKVITEFVAGMSNVLVTTTIIQLGLDMPNTNTLIIDQADKFGLTQLYQLRGRIGRGTNQAYAYFLYNREKQMSTQARKRLRTIFEATELGSGFAIAMKDLEIRGAGNLLGVKQSGHIAAIGFDLYCQMLADAVEELKTGGANEGQSSIDKPGTLQPPSIVLPITAYMPEEYITNLNTRLILYSRLAKIRHQEDLVNIIQELRDRFGPLPEAAKNLLYVARIRVLAIQAEVNSILTHRRHITIKLSKKDNIPADKYHNTAIKIGVTQISIDTRVLGNQWKSVLEKVLQDISNHAPTIAV